MKAAVLYELGGHFEVCGDIELDPPGVGEVTVRIVASGICGSDLGAIAADTTPLPCILGHEAAGDVVEVGAGVEHVTAGDRVVLSFLQPCDDCPECHRGTSVQCRTYWRHKSGERTTIRRRAGDLGIGSTGLAAYAEKTVLSGRAVQPIPNDIPYELAALVGCGVTTGLGAVFNTAGVTPGSTVGVLGCGGVGINVIQGAVIAGAREIVAVDPVGARLEAAKRFGASTTVHPDGLDDAVQERTDGRGLDFVFEVSGRPESLRAGLDVNRRGGTTVVVGFGPGELPITARELVTSQRRLLGSFYGGGEVRSDMRRAFGLWQQGRLDLAGLVTHRLPLDAINDGFELARRGEGIRIVLECA